MLDGRDNRTSGVAVCVIGGTAGVGKTALALHWAHRVAARFPDGQLHTNLLGFDPSGPPADPADVLRGFLNALQVLPERIPVGLEELAAAFRSVLADKRVLIVLDNASSVAQVRPLLPASPDCLVVVTSRRELSALAAREGAALLNLDVLTEAESEELLMARLGASHAKAEPDAVRELARLCARLPLALSVTAARAAAQSQLPLAAIAAELTELRGRLDALEVDDPTANIRTIFSLSYRHLPGEAARMFRLLGLHPGPDISVPAAASLAGVPPWRAKAALRDLARASLIMENVPGRYTFHDLLRAYAAEQARSHESEGDRRAAVQRLLDHYLHTAHAAHLVLYPGYDMIALPPPHAGTSPEAFGGKAAALGWLEAEYQVLLKVIDLAGRSRFDDHAWRLPVVLWAYYNVCGHWHDGAAAHRIALDAARRCGHLGGQARALRGLGAFRALAGDYPEADTCLRQARRLFRQAGDDVGLARTELCVCSMLELQGRYREALNPAVEAMRLSEADPHDRDMQLVRAAALNCSAWLHANLGEHEQARTWCLEALDICRRVGYTPGEAGTWGTLGYVCQHLGDHAEAAACFRRAVELGREIGERYNLAFVLTYFGDFHRFNGDIPAARDAWTEALAILEDLRHLQPVHQIRAKLKELDARTP